MKNEIQKIPYPNHWHANVLYTIICFIGRMYKTPKSITLSFKLYISGKGSPTSTVAYENRVA